VRSEEALNAATAKFVRRFAGVEARVRADGSELADCTLEEMDRHWDAVKQGETA
jgi:ATP diphosphatase